VLEKQARWWQWTKHPMLPPPLSTATPLAPRHWRHATGATLLAGSFNGKLPCYRMAPSPLSGLTVLRCSAATLTQTPLEETSNKNIPAPPPPRLQPPYPFIPQATSASPAPEGFQWAGRPPPTNRYYCSGTTVAQQALMISQVVNFSKPDAAPSPPPPRARPCSIPCHTISSCYRRAQNQ
jgi:hypothetical protein